MEEKKTIDWPLLHPVVIITVFSQNGARLKERDNLGTLVERTRHLFPRNKLRHLFSQLPEFFKIYVTVG